MKLASASVAARNSGESLPSTYSRRNAELLTMSFSLVQLTVPDNLRGRVVSIYMVALRGGWPLGALISGALSDKFTAPVVMTVNCGVLILIAGTLLLRKGGTLSSV